MEEKIQFNLKVEKKKELSSNLQYVCFTNLLSQFCFISSCESWHASQALPSQPEVWSLLKSDCNNSRQPVDSHVWAFVHHHFQTLYCFVFINFPKNPIFMDDPLIGISDGHHYIYLALALIFCHPYSNKKKNAPNFLLSK